ncbi:MAG: DUF3137 domain-containing protein [Lewinella sp.]|nr:DUF3137 domain-containing protein [Lewinella sp.]
MQKTKLEILQQIRPKFAALERHRQQLQAAQERQKILGIAIGVLLVVVVSVCIFGLAGFTPMALFGVLFGGPFVVHSIQKLLVQPIEVDFQQEVSHTISQAMYPELSFNDHKQLGNQVYKTTSVFGKLGAIQGRNMVEGKHGDTHFVMFTLYRLEAEQDNNAAGQSGLGVILDFPKHIKGKTLVMPDQAQKSFGPWLGKMMQEFSRSSDQLVYLEDPEFEKNFVVYSTDQIEARYILTPGMMENLLKLSRKFGNRIYYGFVEGKLYMIVDEVVPFRVGTDLPLQTDRIFYNFIYPVEMVKEIIDTLNLNTRIWSKGED